MVDGVVEENAVLRDNRYLFPKTLQADIINVLPCHIDVTFVRFIETIQKTNNCGFSIYKSGFQKHH